MIDFQELRSAVGIEEVALNFLELKLTSDKDTFRTKCPVCDTEDPRSLLITPAKGVFYCFKAKKGGDVIALVSHCYKLDGPDTWKRGLRDSAETLAEVYLAKDGREKEPPKPPPQDPAPKQSLPKDDKPKKFNRDDYEKRLDMEHDLLKKAGIGPALCKLVGMGYSKNGTNRGRIAIPIYDREGNFLFFASASDLVIPKDWREDDDA